MIMSYAKSILCILLTSILLTACSGKTEPAPAASSAEATQPAAESQTENPQQNNEAQSEQTTDEEEPSQSITFTDDLDREVTVPVKPQRVAALIGSFADVWALAGGTDQIVAAAGDTWTDFDIDLPEDAVNLGSSKKISLESLLAVDPDFVIASCNTDADLALQDSLEEAGIPVAYFKVSTFQEYLQMLDICTQITGQPENYKTYGEDIAAEVEAACAMADGTQPTVLYIRVSPSGCKVKNSENSVLGEMLADLDTINIADSETSLLENLSLETIMQQDPDYIFVVLQATDPAEAEAVLQETLLSNPAWSSLTAVKEGRYYIMDQSLYNLKPNDKWGIAYQGLAEILYQNK